MATNAGIVSDSAAVDGTRIIPMTRRPDGTFRKERKIRPGFTPQEDVKTYTNARLEAARPHKPMIAPSSTSTSVTTVEMSKAQKKNEKRKAKRSEAASQLEKAIQLDPELMTLAMANGAKPKEKELPTTAKQQIEQKSEPNTETVVDAEKKIRALSKKLRQAEQLKERQVRGEALLPEQTEKVVKMDELLAEIAKLSV